MNAPAHKDYHKLAQKQNNFFIPAVPPLTTTSQRLPPGWYYLGAESTVPFVTLIGGDSSQKTFTWGELVQVPDGQMVTIRNESYMKGDIQINSGKDYSSKPARISPVCEVTTNLEFGGLVTVFSGLYPADTRLCRRAYLVLALYYQVPNTIISFQVIGKPRKHSFNIGANGVYNTPYDLPAFTLVNRIPLGMTTSGGIGGGGQLSWDGPMALTDSANWELRILNTNIPNLSLDRNRMFYVLEY